MSIRARLLTAMVVLVAAGLMIANAATYGFLRSSLIGRIDRQLQVVRVEVLSALMDRGSRLSGPPNFDGFRRTASDAPRATYAELRDASGSVIAYRSFGIGAVEAGPELPSDLPGSGNKSEDRSAEVFTTHASGGLGFRYRVLAAPLSNTGGTLVVAIPLVEADVTLRRLLFLELTVTAVVIAAMAAFSLWLVRIGLRPLEQMGAAADAIAGGDLAKRVEPADHRTEVGRLGLALNAMLSRIENAFAEKQASEDRLRRFVADASHELRTPLTSIRGYAELFRRGADTRPDDLAKSMMRIEDESHRMGRLVEELLLLAHLDQGRPLENESVDLVLIAREVVQDAKVISPDHQIDLDAPDEILVKGDELRLRQVVSNLVSNALIHTPSGTRVMVKLHRDDSNAILEVADEGPGLKQTEADRVFDRFYRVDPSRSRQRGGAGLGLSIAAAIAEAHGGRITLDTAPGRGARFQMTIPVSGNGSVREGEVFSSNTGEG